MTRTARGVGMMLTAMALVAVPAGAQDRAAQCLEDAMIVFDASGSMASMGYNGLSQPRIVDARAAMRRALPQISPFRKLGLIVYGPGPNDACSNIDVRMTPTPDAAARIIAEVERIEPDGDTPLTRAVEDAAEVLLYKEKPGVVVLVTDGRETCGGETCQLAAKLAASGPGLVVHVIGFKVRDQSFKWPNSGKWEADGEQEGDSIQSVARCLADRTGGAYVSAESTDALERALRDLLSCPIVSEVALGRAG